MLFVVDCLPFPDVFLEMEGVHFQLLLAFYGAMCTPRETLRCLSLYTAILKGIPSYFFQHFFEIAKRTFIIKGKHLYCALMCKKFVTFHKSNKKIKFYSCTFQHSSRPFCVFYFRFTSNQVTI